MRLECRCLGFQSRRASRVSFLRSSRKKLPQIQTKTLNSCAVGLPEAQRAGVSRGAHWQVNSNHESLAIAPRLVAAGSVVAASRPNGLLHTFC